MDPDQEQPDPFFASLPSHFNLNKKPEYLADSIRTLEAALKEPVSEGLLTYPVPKLSPGGVCSLPREIEEKEFDLQPFFNGIESKDLADLNALVAWLKEATESDWVGVYGVYNGPTVPEMDNGEPPYLIKLAYDGKPSRAWFPLHNEFAERSNNVRAVLHQKILLINDVKAHLAEGGSYYECDPLVQSELCFPVILKGEVVGLIDLEGLYKNQFAEKDVWLAHLASQRIGPMLSDLPWRTKSVVPTKNLESRSHGHYRALESPSPRRS